jgi:hypothetical protein
METSVKNVPEKRISTGGVSVTIWKNQGKKPTGESVEYRTISVQRGYKDKTGQWKNTHSLRINDLPKAILALNKAYEFVVLKEDRGEAISFSEPEEIPLEEIM